MIAADPLGDQLFDSEGWYRKAEHWRSPFCNDRPETPVNALVIHNISLPAGCFGTGYVKDLFLGCLDCHVHPSFDSLRGLEVSSHFFITRDGAVMQFVPAGKRAWHAGVSCWAGRQNLNDFSIGIELEGTDTMPYTDAQYRALEMLTRDLMQAYPITLDNIVGHCDVAPGRKTDPGPAFDWNRYKHSLRT